MKQILYLTLSTLIFVGCKSREEKAAELIKQDMFKTLYDFESYEPIETEIDSVFTSIYTDTLALLYANEANSIFEEMDNAKTEYENARSTMKIWSDSYTSLGRYKFNEAKKTVDDYLPKIDKALSKIEGIYANIKNRNDKIGHSFIGWQAKHKFRCKTKGGNFDLGNYLYVFDKKISQIVSVNDLDNKDTHQLSGIINDALNSEPEEKKEIDGSTSATVQSTADSLANALKGN